MPRLRLIAQNLRLHYTLALCFFAVFLALPTTAFAQKTIRGIVKDASTDQPLVAANIHIIGTYRGTISNDDGRFSLKIPSLPATVQITYIGYHSVRIEVTQSTPPEQEIRLKPSIFEFGAVTVTAEDPGVSIMREVIRRKKIWRAKLLSYRAEAFTRQRLENDTSIVSITESISTAFWDKNQGSKEVIKSKRQTSNLTADQNFAGASYVANFYDDDIFIQGFNVIGPTHPDALDHYHFKLENQRLLDEKTVFDISVKPKGKLQPTFVGMVSVLDEAYALLQVDLRPSEAILFPQPIKEWNLFYKQQFSNFGEEFWLPVDVRIVGSIKISMIGLEFPRFNYRQTSRLTDYEVNITLPDSLFKTRRRLMVDSLTIKENSDSLFARHPDVIPLSISEEAAYATLDSTMTLEKAFKPSGFLARFVDDDDDGGSGGGSGGRGGRGGLDFSPQLSFNRVDGAHLGLSFNPRIKRSRLAFSLAYKTNLEEWAQTVSLKSGFGRRRWSYELGYRNTTEARYQSENFSKTFTSVLPLFGYADYFDYYWVDGFSARLGYRFRGLDLRSSLELLVEDHASREKVTHGDLLRRNTLQRPNPRIQDGRFRSVAFGLDFGDEYVPFGVVGQTRGSLSIEHAPSGFMDNDFSFTQYRLSFDGKIATFLRRRFLPNALDFRITGATSTGMLPIQRFGILDVALQSFAPFGTFRSLRGRPIEGEHHFAVHWEHNFRTVPFEILGLRSLAVRDLGIIVHGAHGRTWIDSHRLTQLQFAPLYQDRWISEIGASLNGLFGVIRIDFTHRLDNSTNHLSFGFRRFF